MPGAVEMLPRYKEDIEEYNAQVEQKENEIIQALQAALKLQWKIRDDFNGEKCKRRGSTL